MEDGWNNFRKTICDVADGVFGKKVKTSAVKNISEKALCLIERKRGLYKNHLSDRSATDKIAEDLEDAARQLKSKILFWHVNKQRGSSHSGLVPVKDKNGATIIHKERVKERWAEHFENVQTEKQWQEKDKGNQAVCDTLEVVQDLFCEEELETVLKGLKNNKTPSADSLVNEFLKYGGSEIENKLLKVMNILFEKGELPNDFRKTLVKPLYMKGDIG